MQEFETVAWVKHDGRFAQAPVAVNYDLDGYRVIGLWIQDSDGKDITTEIEQSEYDLLVEKATRHAVEYMTETAEMNCEGER